MATGDGRTGEEREAGGERETTGPEIIRCKKKLLLKKKEEKNSINYHCRKLPSALADGNV